MPFFDIANLPKRELVPGGQMCSVYQEHVMLTFFTFESGSVVPLHSHPHEQISFVTSGQLEFTLAGQTRILSAGQGAVIPPGAEHGAKALTEATAVDAWFPVREEYKLA